MASRMRRSVTSLVRTWPSTIFWRAVEKPDICGPWNADDAADELAASLEHARRKRNMPSALRTAAAYSSHQGSGRLFDCDREAADQCGDFVQSCRIGCLDG